MKYLFINSYYGYRSTGKIISLKCHELKEKGHQCYVAYARAAIDDDIPKIKIGTKADYVLHGIASRIFDNQGLNSIRATKSFLREIDKLKPDVIWIHNIHGYYINYKLLFEWLKKNPKIIKIWTMHDCWAFTGHCSHFTIAKCNKWLNGCSRCPQKKEYPKSWIFDRSSKNFADKKASFQGVKNLTLITPSAWLSRLIKQSFLKEYNVLVVNNKINLDIFHCVHNDIKKRLGIEGKKMILGVAVGFEKTKGLIDVIAMRKLLNEEYIFVLIGVDKKNIRNLPKGIIGLEKTSNQNELVKFYSAADVFINPTHQDNYPTVNLEARACGTPVITYDVGGSPESAGFEHIIKENDIRAFVDEIKKVCINTKKGKIK